MNSKSKATKIILKSSSLVLILCMLISFAECKKKNSQISEDKVVGLWITTENQYHFGYQKMCYSTILFGEGGTYIKNTFSVVDDKRVSTESGTWVIEKDEIVCYYIYPTRKDSTYTYDGKYIKEGTWTYKKQN